MTACAGSWAWAGVVELAEFGADQAGIGVAGARAEDQDAAELVEDVDGLLPDEPGGGLVAGGVVDVAEVVEIDGPVVKAAKFLVQGEGPLVAGDGLLVMAE